MPLHNEVTHFLAGSHNSFVQLQNMIKIKTLTSSPAVIIILLLTESKGYAHTPEVTVTAHLVWWEDQTWALILNDVKYLQQISESNCFAHDSSHLILSSLLTPIKRLLATLTSLSTLKAKGLEKAKHMNMKKVIPRGLRLSKSPK